MDTVGVQKTKYAEGGPPDQMPAVQMRKPVVVIHDVNFCRCVYSIKL